MTDLMIASRAVNGKEQPYYSDDQREFLLSALRRASADLRSGAYQLDEIGVSLKFNMIDAPGAVSWLDYIGAIHIINAEPFTNKVEVAA